MRRSVPGLLILWILGRLGDNLPENVVRENGWVHVILVRVAQTRGPLPLRMASKAMQAGMITSAIRVCSTSIARARPSKAHTTPDEKSRKPAT